MKYPPERFRIVQHLTEGCFDYHPIWSEYYDFEEREEIVSWGIDRAWLGAMLQELPDHPHPCYTVLDTNPLPDRMRLFIKARFETSEGRILTGWIMNEDAFVVGIYTDDKEFVFSAHPLMAQEMQQQWHKLKEVLGNSTDPIFPLHYTTDYFDRAGRAISGKFAIPDINL